MDITNKELAFLSSELSIQRIHRLLLSEQRPTDEKIVDLVDEWRKITEFQKGLKLYD